MSIVQPHNQSNVLFFEPEIYTRPFRKQMGKDCIFLYHKVYQFNFAVNGLMHYVLRQTRKWEVLFT